MFEALAQLWLQRGLIDNDPRLIQAGRELTVIVDLANRKLGRLGLTRGNKKRVRQEVLGIYVHDDREVGEDDTVHQNDPHVTAGD